MSETLATYMKIAMTMVVLSAFVIGMCYQALKTTNEEHHDKVDKYQIQTK
ncbi:hypothetical protein ACFYKX_25485 [Cytobacillus sp. FJAT-54145]|uniref:YtzI protein n=1 Tax=Cytobacillus spartinae TaxID=3299023 RepID=A0ABW6KJL3_9BACI